MPANGPVDAKRGGRISNTIQANKDKSRLSVSGMMKEIADFQGDNDKSVFAELSNIVEMSIDDEMMEERKVKTLHREPRLEENNLMKEAKEVLIQTRAKSNREEKKREVKRS